VGRGLVIVGTGGMGREAAAWADDAGRADDLVGFLDDGAGSRDSTVAGLPVLGDTSWLDEHPDVEAVVAIGTPAVREAVVDRLLARRGAARDPRASERRGRSQGAPRRGDDRLSRGDAEL
jgi:FlaA1/EpsC-like NDP-sugar epimerase